VREGPRPVGRGPSSSGDGSARNHPDTGVALPGVTPTASRTPVSRTTLSPAAVAGAGVAIGALLEGIVLAAGPRWTSPALVGAGLALTGPGLVAVSLGSDRRHAGRPEPLPVG
jgi:hypothetical protein